MALFRSNDLKSIQEVKPVSASKSVKSKTSGSVVNRKEELEIHFGEIQDGECCFYFTDGAWSNHDLIEFLVEKSGPSKLWISTWGVGEEAFRRLHHLLTAGKITEINCLFDHRISRQKAKELQLVKGTASRICFKKNHSKVIAIVGEHHSFSIYTSANLTHNPRMEAGVVHCGKAITDFTTNFLNQEMNESGGNS